MTEKGAKGRKIEGNMTENTGKRGWKRGEREEKMEARRDRKEGEEVAENGGKRIQKRGGKVTK